MYWLREPWWLQSSPPFHPDLSPRVPSTFPNTAMESLQQKLMTCLPLWFFLVCVPTLSWSWGPIAPCVSIALIGVIQVDILFSACSATAPVLVTTDWTLDGAKYPYKSHPTLRFCHGTMVQWSSTFLLTTGLLAPIKMGLSLIQVIWLILPCLQCLPLLQQELSSGLGPQKIYELDECGRDHSSRWKEQLLTEYFFTQMISAYTVNQL